MNGEDVFKLYDTYGFPYDLTEIMANEKGLTIDKDGFDKAMEQQRKQSRTKASFKNYSDLISHLPSRDGEIPATKFIRDSMITQSEVKKVELFKDLTYGHETVILILDKTPFYVESGGQISDSGRIYTDTLTVEVTKVYMHRDWYIHHGALLNGNIEDFKKGAYVTAEVDADRRWDIMRNHTATHLSHAALRKVLGRHIKQSGSYVGPDRMRFDFSHHQPMTPDEISRVEEIVNNEILQGTPVSTEEMDIETAKKSGAMALFGEKYEDKVRVVSIGGFSKELCGGTHVDSINQIGPFIIALETGVASGVRRLEAITGREAVRYMLDAKKYRQKVAGIVGRPETDSLSGVEQLKEQLHNTQKELKKVKAEMFSKGSGSVGDEQKISSISYITHNFGKTDREIMAGWIDSQKAQDKPLVAVGLGNVNGKMTCMVASSRKAVDDFNINAGKISKDILPKFGGRGGGKPAFAQGTVASNTDAEDIYNSIKTLILKGVEGINE
ncbi:MAG: alanine--tRNA ligase-related protein [Candidatus Zixiibacteriota bacterium]